MTIGLSVCLCCCSAFTVYAVFDDLRLERPTRVEARRTSNNNNDNDDNDAANERVPALETALLADRFDRTVTKWCLTNTRE